MKASYIVGLVSVLCALGLGACSSAPKVTRVSADTQLDLSGYWNDTDVRKVCDSLVNDCLKSPRVNNALGALGGKTPRVLVDLFYNDSQEHIDTSIIPTMMESALFNSGRFDFVAGGRARDQIRKERQNQQREASVETAAKLGKELGAGYLMTGSVKSMVDRAGNLTARTYYVTGELINVETGQKIWNNTNSEIKKLIKQPGARF